MISARASDLLIASVKEPSSAAAYGLFYFNEQGTGGSTRLFINYPVRGAVHSYMQFDGALPEYFRRHPAGIECE